MIECKRYIGRCATLLVATFSVLQLSAQTESQAKTIAVRDTAEQHLEAVSHDIIDVVADYPMLQNEFRDDPSLFLVPTFPSISPYPTFGYRPFFLPPIYSHGIFGPMTGFWNIHEGFNADLEAGVSVGLGKNNPWRGASFFTHFTGLYALPINDRLTVAAGATYSRYTGWGRGLNGLNVFGLANYRINERLDITGFLSHDFRPGFGQTFDRRTMPYIPGYGGQSTTIGADLGIKVGENAKINVGVSFTREEQPNMMPTPRSMQNQPQRNF